MTEEQKKSFEDAVKPLMKWMNENIHPHAVVVVNHDSAEILEGLYYFYSSKKDI
jgi:hypothetical protein